MLPNRRIKLQCAGYTRRGHPHSERELVFLRPFNNGHNGELEWQIRAAWLGWTAPVGLRRTAAISGRVPNDNGAAQGAC